MEARRDSGAVRRESAVVAPVPAELEAADGRATPRVEARNQVVSMKVSHQQLSAAAAAAQMNNSKISN